MTFDVCNGIFSYLSLLVAVLNGRIGIKSNGSVDVTVNCDFVVGFDVNFVVNLVVLFDNNEKTLLLYLQMKGEELTAENLRSTYLKVPLLNLTEAIKKTTSFVKYEKNCPTGVTSHTITPFGLTPDDLAAIKAYTSACGLYSDLNAALRTEKIEKIQPWFSYLKLFDTAINKIPPVKRRYCRGITVSPNSSYTVGTVITWVSKVTEKTEK
ncbi:unnamed protein product [Adineta steineri]|uniref:Uncharacterized protein n=1 Tax=Adineta steineri TaxID=433720 RepID=A0A820G9U5_9BILA|nr:unnamed protein product [Adineta steineri]